MAQLDPQDHRREAVAEHVVDVASDPGSLVADGQAGPQVGLVELMALERPDQHGSPAAGHDERHEPELTEAPGQQRDRRRDRQPGGVDGPHGRPRKVERGQDDDEQDDADRADAGRVAADPADGTITRIDIRETSATCAGIRIGSTKAEVLDASGDRIVVSPHEYDPSPGSDYLPRSFRDDTITYLSHEVEHVGRPGTTTPGANAVRSLAVNTTGAPGGWWQCSAIRPISKGSPHHYGGRIDGGPPFLAVRRRRSR